MFAIALDLKLSDFRALARAPKPLLVGMASQFIVLPVLTFGLLLVFRPQPSIALGLILVAACPGGNVSNFFSQQAGGNVALSVSLTAVATVSAVFLTPVNFEFWSSLYLAKGVDVIIKLEFWQMFKTVLLLLFIPLIVGIWFSSNFKKITQIIAKPIRIISFFILIGFIVIAFYKNIDIFAEYYDHVIYIVFLQNALALSIGYYLGKLSKLPKVDRKTISIETGIQNSGLALIIVFTLFDGNGGMALTAAWYGIWHLISVMIIAYFYSGKKIIVFKTSR
jgi:BASS family bile acid:Na+ symporter